MALNDIETLLEKQRHFFKEQLTKSISFRKQHLKALRKEIKARENDIYEALYKDFKKSQFESYISETGIILSELDLVISKLKIWARPERIKPSMLNFPSSDYIYREPYGNALIIAPWNYPFSLAFAPLIGAIAAGNTAVVKPSELTPHTSALIKKIIEAVFDEAHVTVVEGAVETSKELLRHRWNYIFFTGSVSVGKIIAKAAAEYMTPVTLELGGKSPCIIDETANIKRAAKRIVWGKLLNAGQTCIAPDYILIKEGVKAHFITHAIKEIEKAYSATPSTSEDYPRIINKKNFDRLARMLQNETIVHGGDLNANDLYISPTLIDNPSLDSAIMKEEIFGPLLPIIAYKNDADLDTIINSYDKPLSFYIFSKNRSFIKNILTTFWWRW